ncbi:MAG: CDGSH iron-sulfur domain-containing protein [Gammaproteobacteria bacterium]|jgi:CDGSH-type Zn-finger protein|nr:CDGSH iron-sulfur domain-containing protein [Gammaproteobacteria bacterium]
MKITLVENGPLLIEARGEWSWTGTAGTTTGKDRVALCRCGAAATKPFCDGSHKKIGFIAAGDTCELKTG